VNTCQEALDNANRAAQRDEGLKEYVKSVYRHECVLALNRPDRRALRAARAEISRLHGQVDAPRDYGKSHSYSESSMQQEPATHGANTGTSSRGHQSTHQHPTRPADYGQGDRQRRTFSQGDGPHSREILDGFGQPMIIPNNNTARKRAREASPLG